MSSIIKISSADELPFGLLSNHYKHPIIIDKQEWESVSQYIYVNLIPYEYESYRNDLLRVKNHKFLYTNFINLSNIIYHEEIIKLLEQGIKQKFSIPKYKNILLNTGNSRLIYNNPTEEFLGTKSIKHYMIGCIPGITFRKNDEDNIILNEKTKENKFEFLPLKIEQIKSLFQSPSDDKLNTSPSDDKFKDTFLENHKNKLKDKFIGMFEKNDFNINISKKDSSIIFMQETNMLGKILENLRFKIRKQYEEDILYEPFAVLCILQDVFTQEDENILSEYFNLIKDKITFDEIIEKYGKEKIKSKLPVDYVSLYRENDFPIQNKDGYTCYGCGLQTKSLLNHQEFCIDKKELI